MKRFAGLIALMVGAAVTIVGPAGAAGVPSSVPGRGTLTPSFVTETQAPWARGDAAEVARSYLASRPEVFRIPDASATLRLLETLQSPQGTTVRFGQVHRGVPVFGAQYLVHLDRAGDRFSASSANGHYFTGLSVRVVPELTEISARDLATMRVRSMRLTDVERHGLTILPRGDGVLAYHFTLRGWLYRLPARVEVFVDAINGSVALAYNNIQFEGPTQGSGTRSHGDQVSLNVFERGSNFELRDRGREMFTSSGGEITTHDAQGASSFAGTSGNIVRSSSSSFSSSATASGAVDAHYGAGLVYEFYRALGRNSLDGNGGDIISTVNATEPGGIPMFNAFWDGTQMVYGNPDPVELHPFSADLDVVGHELTHGVIEHSANLVYLSQPGAMNEAIADYFGNTIDMAHSPTTPADQSGYVGEDLCKVPAPSQWTCPLRDLNDGATVDDYLYVLVDDDNGGVHYNSTIYAGALWDVREALGGPRADAIVYKALTEFHTPLDEFMDGRNAMIGAAQALSASAQEIAAIEAAFDARGIVAGWDDPAPAGSSVLVEGVAPYGFFGGLFAPVASGGRFVIGDYPDKRQVGIEPMRLYAGNVDGSGGLTEVGESSKSSTVSDEAADISGRKVVWHQLTVKSGAFDFAVKKRTLGGSAKTVISAKGTQAYPSIDGKTIVWEDTRSGQTDVWMKKGSGKPKKVKGGRGEQYNPQVAGSWVSWWNAPISEAPSIGLKNVKTKEEFIIRPSPGGFVGVPSMGPDFMTWFSDFDGDGVGSIVKLRYGSRRVKVLVSEDSPLAPVWTGQILAPPVVSTNGKFVAYSDEFPYAAYLNGVNVAPDQVGRDVWLVSAKGGEPTLATTARGDQAYPAMASEATVLWLDGSAGRTDLTRN